MEGDIANMGQYIGAGLATIGLGHGLRPQQAATPRVRTADHGRVGQRGEGGGGEGGGG